ncbi:MotE family protein [Magnetofaba australis]|uniref:Magnesium transporter MgtE intracellular domain-containing protein n=1 Tax=Magnetofaba australis IT-1 TaxID=1434232 RepID=A0A1Y2K3U3_9PROT|nr:hypothetical protein [Magnetofaba australis]OSM03936.1 hypothetical protein MAIT1_01033 [Magnetofaba australis IT-1]
MQAIEQPKALLPTRWAAFVVGWMTALLLLLALTTSANAQQAAPAPGQPPAAPGDAMESAPPAAVVTDQDKRIKDPIQLLQALEKRRMNLDARAKLLETREAEVKRMEEQLSRRIAAMEALRAEIRRDLEEEKRIDDANIARLAKVFSSMKPKQAGAQLEGMERATAVKVLRVLREKTAAKILDKMNRPAAVELADEIGLTMGERRRRRNQ